MPDSSTTPATPTFAELGLEPPLQRAAAQAGWAQPTPVQAQVVPQVLAGRDVLALAPTGSGKTGAFLLPLLQRWLAQANGLDERPRKLAVLVLSPTRELAVQTHHTLQALAADLPRALHAVLAVGGVSINPQMMALRGGANVVVATPGRLLDLVAHNAVSLSQLGTLVLDEADRLLDLGFADEIQRVLALLPAHRQTLLLSATWPADVATLAQQVLQQAVRCELPGCAPGDAATPDITQRAIEVDTARRTPLLRHLLATEGWDSVMVFVASQYASEHVADKLRRNGVPAQALHGALSAGRRSQVLTDLKARRIRVLVATDLAARGIDVPQLAAVVNLDLPRSPSEHTHRIGRTGRAGASGVAISFICADAPGSEAHFRLIEKRQAQRVLREQVAGFEPAAVLPASTVADPNGGVKGRRMSKKDKLRAAAAQGRARGA